MVGYHPTEGKWRVTDTGQPCGQTIGYFDTEREARKVVKAIRKDRKEAPMREAVEIDRHLRGHAGLPSR